MYTKDQVTQLRQAFWTTFGQYMSPVLSSEGMRKNWINYKTGLKDVYFRMQADKKTAYIAIEITHADPELQEMFFEQFLALKNFLHETLGETWKWELQVPNEHGRIISRIYKELTPVSIFNKENWPELISFFKPRIIALDEFWSNAQYSFDELK